MAFGKKRQRLEAQSREQGKIEEILAMEEDNNQEEVVPGAPKNQEPSYSQHNKHKPLHGEVTFHPDSDTGKNAGGSKRWTCNHCKKSYTSSYTRIHHHVFGSTGTKKAQVARCYAILSNSSLRQRLEQKVREAEKAGVSPTLSKSTLTDNNNKPTAIISPVTKAFGIVERNEVDVFIARALCANGIPFNVLRNPDFLNMLKAVNHAPKDYKPPSYDKARTTLVDECERELQKELAPVKDTWATNGTSIVSDGWTNVKREPLINVVASNSRGSMFMYAENFTGVEKTGAKIAEFLLKSIDEIGPSNVLQVVTDNAANCKAAGKEIEKVHKHIFWSRCAVHTLNLIFKDFAGAFPWMNETYKRGKNIVKYFLNHEKANAIFKTQSSLELLKVAKTRFASHHILLRRLSRCREALATTIVLRTWKNWLISGDENAKTLGNEVATTIADDDFWEEVDNILAITQPIYLMIKFADGEGEKMGEVYEKLDCMIGEIRDVMVNNKHVADHQKMEEILVTRWEKMNIPMHCLGFALNPFYYDSNYLNSPAPGGVPRRAPNHDKEVVVGVLKAFDKIGEDENEKAELRRQLAIFQNKQGVFGTAAARIDATRMSPVSWWSTFGAETPELSEIAIRVLSQPISSSSAERVWSTYSYIHNIKRNRLNAKRADKLVFIHSNIRLLSRFTQAYMEGPCRKWDIDPESAYFDDSTIKLEDLRMEDWRN